VRQSIPARRGVVNLRGRQRPATPMLLPPPGDLYAVRVRVAILVGLLVSGGDGHISQG